MQNSASITTGSTSLSRRNTEPSRWSEEQKRSYLLQINNRENPQELGRLQVLFDQGHSADQIAQLCNEHGHLTYSDWSDPNALINRFEFTDAENPENNPATGTRENALDRGYYFPTIVTIQQTRELVEQTLKDHEIIAKKPDLITVEDYRAYFAKFHPNTLDEIIRNMKCIEITQGCNGMCKKECYLEPEGPAKSHMPFEIVTWLIDRYMDLHPEIAESKDMEFKKEKMPILFYASDLADYKYEGKTSADIFRYVRKKYGIELSKSISYSLSSSTIEWIYQVAIVDNIGINRISQLNTGKIQNPKDRLYEKLEARAAKDGKTISRNQWNGIEFAMNMGIKRHLNINAGPGMPEDLEEKDMAAHIYHCFHGTVCRAGKGFTGSIMRPTTKLYKKQLMEFPLDPTSETGVRIPSFHNIRETTIPFIRDPQAVISRPLIITMDKEGNKTHVDQRTTGEERLRQLSRVKHIYQLIITEIFSHVDEENGRRAHKRTTDVMKKIIDQANDNTWQEEKLEDYRRVAGAMANSCASLRKILQQGRQIIESLDNSIDTDALIRINYMIIINDIIMEVGTTIDELQKIGTEVGEKATRETKKLMIDEYTSLLDQYDYYLDHLQELKGKNHGYQAKWSAIRNQLHL